MSKLANLYEQLESIQAQIQELEKVREPQRKRVGQNENYYIITNYYEVYREHDNRSYLDNLNYNTGDYFLTREEAEKESDKRKRMAIIHQTLQDVADKLNDGRIFDWTFYKQSKYFLLYNHRTKNIMTETAKGCEGNNTVYCLEHNFLNAAVQEIGLKDLVYYLTNGQIDLPSDEFSIMQKLG